MTKIITPDYIDDTHQYFVDGEERISVTQALSLNGLYAPYLNLPAKKLEIARNRGIFLDDWITEYLFGRETPVVPAEYLPWIDGFLEWAQYANIEPIEAQTRMVCLKHGYCGTDDLYCKFNGKYAELDYKGTYKVMETVRYQLAAYGSMRKQRGQPVDELRVLHVTKKGTKCHVFNKPENINDLKMFVAIFLTAKLYKGWL